MSSLRYVFLFFGFIAVTFRNVRAFTEEELAVMKSGFRPFVEDCSKEFGVDMEDIKKAKELGDVESLDPCLLACFGKKIGVITEKGEFDSEKASELTKKFIANEDEQKKSIEVIEKCSSVNEQSVGDDKGCERALLLYKCFKPYKDQVALAN